MSRHLTLLLLAGGLCAAGCRLFDNRQAAVLPGLRNRVDTDAAYADRFRQRYDPVVVSDPGGCGVCSNGGYSFTTGGLMSGTPLPGGGYAVPTGASFGGGTVVPGLGQPVYPAGDGLPLRPRRDDELPPPGGYSNPLGAETGRAAPKPPNVVPTGK